MRNRLYHGLWRTSELDIDFGVDAIAIGVTNDPTDMFARQGMVLSRYKVKCVADALNKWLEETHDRR